MASVEDKAAGPPAYVLNAAVDAEVSLLRFSSMPRLVCANIPFVGVVQHGDTRWGNRQGSEEGD